MSRFNYVKYDEKATILQENLKLQFENLEERLSLLCDGRSKSLALTKLEEAYMWIGKAIRDEQIFRNGSKAHVFERSDS